MARNLRDKLIGHGGDTPLAFLRRALSVGWRSGFVSQMRPGGLGRLAALLPTQPLGPGLVHALHAASFGDREYVVTPDMTLTYDAFDRRVNQLVHGLRRLGLRRGEKLVLMSPNSWQYLLGFFAAIRGGFSAVHASYRLTAPELSYIVTHAEARAVIFAPTVADVAREVQRQHLEDTHWIATGGLDRPVPGVHQLADVLAGQPQHFPRGRLRLLGAENVVYTSGTTGRPKGAVRNMADMGIAEALGILERLAFTAGERHLVVCPLYHSGAQAFAALHSGLGSTLVVAPRFDPEHTLRTLHEQRIDSVFMVPTMIRQILELPAAVRARYRPHLRCLISGAAPFPHALRLRAIRYFGEVVFDFYGTTENGWLTLVDSAEMLARPGTVGRAIAGAELVIVDDQGQRLPPGEVGRITALSPMVIEGYHADAQATRESRLGDKQISGDLGYLDADGYLYLAGRSSDMIITGGVNTYPAEIEQVLADHPAVLDVAVAGLPDKTWGEVVAAFCVGPGPAQVPDLEHHCRERLAGFKVPRVWHFLDELPRNPTGKVLKRQLRADYGAR